MNGKDEQTSGGGGVGEDAPRPTRYWAIVVFFAVGGFAWSASRWLSAHLMGITTEQRVFIVEFAAYFVPTFAVWAASERMDLGQPGPRRCFLLIWVAVLAVAIPSHLLVLAVLRPWLDAEAGVLAQLGLMLPAYAIPFAAVIAAQKSVTRLCRDADWASDKSDGAE